jgi:D-lactate dehydrogenase
MKTAFFDTHPYDRHSFEASNQAFGHELVYFESRLSAETAALAEGFLAVCAFVNDTLDRAVLERLHQGGTRVVALRCAGFNNVDLAAAEALGMAVVRVPAYSPHAVAEHAVALLLCLNRKIHRAYARVREGNFALSGLVGFDMNGKTVGVVGTGKIGQVASKIFAGFGCRVLAHDPYPDAAFAERIGVEYVPFASLLSQSDIISLHLPLTTDTTHLIDDGAIAHMKPGAILINTSRGGLVDTGALIRGLKSEQLGGAALDVYEREAGVFFEDFSLCVIQDDELARLLTFPNVLITGHQAFLTETALGNIADTTLANLQAVADGSECPNMVTRAQAAPPRT